MPNPAEGYESYMVPALFGPCAANLIQAADLRPGERVLDVGCGAGIVARQVASRLGARGAVTGFDLSPNMLAVAKAAAAREGMAIEWREGNAEQLPFPESSFDLVLCEFALMFFADKSAALAEMRRVVTPNGRVLVTVWQGLDRHPFYQTLHNVIQQRVGISALRDIFCTRQCRGAARPGAERWVSANRDRTLFPDGALSRSRCVYYWRNRSGYGCDSFDAASRRPSSAGDRFSHHRRYAIASRRGDIRQSCGDTVPCAYRESMAVTCDVRQITRQAWMRRC
jgi:SAM-dependent methyltransferase